MSVSPIAIVTQVAELSPRLTVLFEDHVKDNFGEVLSHIFLGDVTRHVIALVRAPTSEDSLAVRRELRTILDAMEHCYATGGPEVQELIAASFLENLPAKDEPGSEIRRMVGANLGDRLAKMT